MYNVSIDYLGETKSKDIKSYDRAMAICERAVYEIGAEYAVITDSETGEIIAEYET